MPRGKSYLEQRAVQTSAAQRDGGTRSGQDGESQVGGLTDMERMDVGYPEYPALYVEFDQRFNLLLRTLDQTQRSRLNRNLTTPAELSKLCVTGA